GIPAERIQLVEASQSLFAHLAMYGQIDVAIDTFPYHGTTTTCEALWMGVPVVSCIGSTHVSRVGLTLLKAVGMDALAADSQESYVLIAKELVNNPDRLRILRSETRSCLIASPLCDPVRLTRAMEDALRQMFTSWAA